MELVIFFLGVASGVAFMDGVSSLDENFINIGFGILLFLVGFFLAISRVM